MLLVAPFWASEVLRMFALVLLLANRGALNAALRWAGLTQAPVSMLYGDGAVLAGLVYTVLLTMLLPLYAALDRLPAELLEAAADLGAGAWARFWQVALPLSASGVAAGTALTFLACLGVFAAPSLLGGPSKTLFATTIADLFGAASGRWPVGAAFGFILLTVGTACAVGLAALAPEASLLDQPSAAWRGLLGRDCDAATAARADRPDELVRSDGGRLSARGGDAALVCRRADG